MNGILQMKEQLNKILPSERIEQIIPKVII